MVENSVKKTIKPFLGFIVFLVAAGAATAQAHRGFLEANWVEANANAAAPSLIFKDANAEERSLEDYLGKAVIVNFWATWCAPCRAEMPTLQALAERAFDGGEHVVLAIALERNIEVAQRYLDDLGASNLELALDAQMTGFRGLGEQNQELEDLRGLPSSFVVSVDGRLLGHIAGPADWDEPFAHQLVKQALGAMNSKE